MSKRYIQEYRKNLLRAIYHLEEAYKGLNQSLRQLAVSGELHEVEGIFTEGEKFEFKHSDFDHLNDQNIQHVLPIIQLIEEKYETLKNINQVSTEEITKQWEEDNHLEDEED